MRNKKKIYLDAYNKNAHKVRGYLYNQLGNIIDVDDVFQDIFAGLWKALKTFRGDCKIDTLLYTITVRNKNTFLWTKYSRVFSRSDKNYIYNMSQSTDFKINMILHPLFTKYLDNDNRELILAVKKTREHNV